jgi:iron complex outermembrane receptor protein
VNSRKRPLSRQRHPATLGAIALGLVCPTPAPAEDQNSLDEATEVLGQVTVTAQRREENLQRVPIAVTALTSTQLNRAQIAELYGVQYAVPALWIAPTVGNNLNATISLRGQAEVDFVPTVDPAVGLYLDGAYIARATGANLGLVDIERVEVLRGPQGILFGRNTTGGAISLVANKPTSTFEGSLDVRVGNFSTLDVTGVLNLPLNTETALRVAANHLKHSGYGRAVLLDRELNADDSNFLRGQLRLLPTDDWTLDLSFDLTSAHTSTQLITFIAAFGDTNTIPADSGHPEDSLDRYANVVDGNVQDNRAGGFDAQVWGASATLSGDLAGLSFRSITAWRELDLDVDDNDNDGTPYDVLAVIRRRQDEQQFSQEFQLQGGAFGDRLDWTAGVLYFAENATLEQRFVAFVANENVLRGTARNESWAGYAQATATFKPNLRLTAGARYNVDVRQLISENTTLADGEEICNVSPQLLDNAQVCKATLPRQRYSYVPLTVGLDYTPADTALLYAKVSRGYRSGGYNMRPGPLLTFGPEKVVAYEVGAKTDFFEQRLRTNLALYYSDYDDIQLGQFVSDPTGDLSVIRQNAGEARIQGGELEITALLAHLRLTGALGISDGKYTKVEPDVEGITTETPLALPETTFSMAADLPMSFNFGRFLIHGDYSWRSDDSDAVALERCGCHTAYGLINATISATRHGSDLEFVLWGRNLTDTHYKAQWVDYDFFINEMPGDPRTYGLSVSYAFGSKH